MKNVSSLLKTAWNENNVSLLSFITANFSGLLCFIVSSIDGFLLSIGTDSFKNASGTKCANNPMVSVMELKSDVLPDICKNMLAVCVRRGPSQFKLVTDEMEMTAGVRVPSWMLNTGTIKTNTIQAT